MTAPTEDDVDQLRREIEGLRDELATTRHDVDRVKSQTRTQPRRGPRGEAEPAPRDWRDVTRDNTSGLRWMAHPFKLRYSRKLYHWRNRVRRWLVGFTVWLIVTGVAAMVWGKGSPWAPDVPEGCQKTAAATASNESAAVRWGRINGALLHKLTGPPPDPAKTQAAAERAGKAAVVSFLAFKASARGEKDPAAVTSSNAAYTKRKAAQQAQTIAACTPKCPNGTKPGGDSLTVANRAGAADDPLTRRAAAAAGFTGAHLEEAVAVADAESQFNPLAANPRSTARGLWQIMLTAHGDDPEIGKWRDPYANARMAYRISSGGTNWAPWSTWPAVRRQMGSRSAQLVSGAANAGASTTCAVYPTTAGKGPGPWGGYQNGRIPTTALTHPRTAPTALFRPDAAAAFDQLSDAYKARFGTPLPVTDSYRDYASQVRTKAAKPGLAATPGTSDHGWGLAADLGGGIQRFGTPQYQWMKANEGRFGWTHEAWAEPGGSRPEPWHHTYVGKGAAA